MNRGAGLFYDLAEGRRKRPANLSERELIMGRRDYLEAGLTLHPTDIAPTPDELFQRGLAHATGRNAPYNLVAAHKWFSIAALHGSRRAKHFRTELARELSRAELRKAQREARAWLKRHG